MLVDHFLCLWKNVYSSPLSIFKLFLFLYFCYWVLWVPYILLMLTHYQIHGFQIFSSNLYIAFHIDYFFCWAEICSLKVSLIFFVVVASAFGAILKNSLLWLMSRSFSPMFSSGGFGLGLIIKYLIHFELIFVSDVK